MTFHRDLPIHAQASGESRHKSRQLFVGKGLCGQKIPCIRKTGSEREFTHEFEMAFGLRKCLIKSHLRIKSTRLAGRPVWDGN